MIEQPNRSLNLLYPPFAEKVQQGLLLAEKVGLHAAVFEGWRSIQRQGALFAQGRTTPGKIITYARPWQSLHQYGVAVDIVFDGDEKPGVQWSWEGDYADGKKDDYAQLAVIMKSLGFEWLGDKNIERAHFQLSYGMSVMQMARISEDRGLLGLWSAFDSILAQPKKTATA
jgi:peptidoglycan L-alanyl-D-glutamate endopeptidase CwlK